MKKNPIMEKLRAFRCSLSRSRQKSAPRPRPVTRLNATATMRRSTAMDDYDDDQPTTRLSSAFLVVLILHIVAVGGIFAFKGIKAHRLSREVPLAVASHPAAAHPVVGEITGGTHAPAVQAEAPVPALAQMVYVAHGGETLAKVALQNGVSVSDLAQLNGIKPNALLKPNQNVVIPGPKTAKTAPKTAVSSTPNKPAAVATVAPAAGSPEAKKAAFLTAQQQKEEAALAKTTPKPAATASAIKPFANAKTYTVARNDTVTSIARKHGITTEALMKANKIDDPKKLQLNQTLQIPAKKTE